MITAGHACGAAFVLAGLSWGSLARAGPQTPRRDEPGDERPAMIVALDWKRGAGAEGCIDTAALEHEVEGRLDRRVFGNAMEAHVFLRGQVERRETDYQAHLSLVAANGRTLGERELRSDALDCSRLDESLAIVIALAIDSLRAIPVTALRVPKAAPRETWSARLGVAAVASVGILPRPGVGFGAEVGVQPPAFWPIEARFTVGFSSRAELAGHGADIYAMQGQLATCPLAYGSTYELRGCFGAEIDRLQATGFALDIQRTPVGWVVAPVGKLEATANLGHTWGFTGNFSLAVPVLRDRFTFVSEQGQEVLYEPSRAAVLFGIGFFARIP